MRATRRRIGRPAWLGLGLVVALPAMAEAQLFPNRTITRERQPCATEPPFYSTVRRNYFGYYPTCWSKFPDGWGCPCPNLELPNRVAEFQERPRDAFEKPLPENDIDMPLDDGDPPAAGRAMDGQDLPAVPTPGRGRSPFPSELNRGGNLDSPTTPDPTLPPRTNSPAGRTGPRPDPGTTPTPPDPSTSATGRPSGTSALLEMPPISAPASAAVVAVSNPDPTPDAGKLTLANDAAMNSTESAERPNLGPLPPAPTPNTSVPAETIIDPSLLAGTPATATPAQAPQRKSILGGLFGSSRRRR